MSRRDGIDRLVRVLDVYGADAGRWPAGEAKALEALLSDDPEAQRLLAEARAFDDLLATGEATEPDEAVASRVVAGALARIRADGNEAAIGGTVVDLSMRRLQRDRPVGAGQDVRRPGRERREFPSTRRTWQAAALLAASLVAGFAVGATGLTERALEPIGVVVAGSVVDMEDDFFGLFGEVGQSEDLI
ncbi:MAG: hypothetical protein GC150_15315 [Rhizobiales bacterium]|nr:hypothetical protein [Hyphomicrobiales bacterium]